MLRRKRCSCLRIAGLAIDNAVLHAVAGQVRDMLVEVVRNV